MSSSDRMYRIQKRLLIGIFLFLIVAFSLCLVPGIDLYFRIPSDYFQLEQLRLKWKIFWSAAQVALLLAFLFFLARALLVRKSPDLRLSWNDERARTNRLRAFRPAFFVVLFIQVITRSLMFIFGAQYYLAGQSIISIIAGIMALAGMALFYDRELKHE